MVSSEISKFDFRAKNFKCLKNEESKKIIFLAKFFRFVLMYVLNIRFLWRQNQSVDVGLLE